VTARDDLVTEESALMRYAPMLATLWLIVFAALFYTSDLPNSVAKDDIRLDVVFQLPSYYAEMFFGESEPGSQGLFGTLAERLPFIMMAGFLVASAIAVGRTVLRLMTNFQEMELLTRLAFSGPIGLSVLSLYTLTCGWFCFLDRRFIVGSLIVVLLYEFWRTVPALRWESVKSCLPGRMGSASLVVVAPFVWVMLLGALLPSTDFDVREYHLEGPKEFFLAGRVHYLPHNVYTSFPFLTEMLSLLSMVVSGDWWNGAIVGKTVLMSFGPMTALCLYVLGRKLMNESAGWIAVVLYLTTPWVYRISIIAYTEGALCCFGAVSLLALIEWGQATSANSTRHSMGLISICGFLSGSAIATKYPGLVMVAIPIGVAVVAITLLQKRPMASITRVVAMYSVGVLIAFGPWMLKNTVETGNPVYPLVDSVFKSPEWNEELDAKWKRGHGRPRPVIQAPGKMWDDFKANANDVAIRNDWQSMLLFGLAPLVLLQSRKRGWGALTGALAATMLLVWYTMTHLLDRFWVPVLPLIAVLAGVGAICLVERSQSKKSDTPVEGLMRRGGLLTLWSLGLFSIVFNFAIATSGLSGDNAYFMEYDQARLRIPPSIAIADSFLKPGDTVLFVGEAQVFDSTFSYRYNTVFDESLFEMWTANKVGPDEWEMKTDDEIRLQLRDEKISHLLVNWNEVLRYRTTYGYTNFVSPARMAKLVEMGTLEEIDLHPSSTYREWDGLDPSWQTEIERWGPELKRRAGRIEAMEQYQIYRVVFEAD